VKGSPAYLRARALASRLGISERTIRRWIADGTIPSVKIGGARLVPEAGLARLLALGSSVEGSSAYEDEVA
jgi:excisionase family DNA binding protein